jgi:2-phospho-L-lactate/phosphoenolpyruvate guanylyltransferase
MRLEDAGPALAPLHALVPMRTLSGGKARLGLALDAEEREELVLGMLRHTLTVLTDWPVCAAVHLVSPDRTLLRAAGPAVRTHLQIGEGLNEGIRQGRAAALAAGAATLLVLPGDLPHLEPDALDRLALAADATVAAARGGPVVVVAAADARAGTNALLMRPGDIIEPHFGAGSLEAHLRAAAAADAAVQVVTDPVLGFDLDTPDDLERVDPGRLRDLVTLGLDASGVAAP